VNNACRQFADFDHSGFDNHGINWGTGTLANKEGLNKKQAGRKERQAARKARQAAREARQTRIDPRCLIAFKKLDNTYSIDLDELMKGFPNAGGEKWRLRAPVGFTDYDFFEAIENECNKLLKIRKFPRCTLLHSKEEFARQLIDSIGGIQSHLTNLSRSNYTDHDLPISRFRLSKNDFVGDALIGAELDVQVQRKDELSVLTYLADNPEYRWKKFEPSGVTYFHYNPHGIIVTPNGAITTEVGSGPGLIRAFLNEVARNMKKSPDPLLPDTKGSIFVRRKGAEETNHLNPNPVNIADCLTRTQFENTIPLAVLKSLPGGLNTYEATKKHQPSSPRKIAQMEAYKSIKSLPTGTENEKQALRDEIHIYLNNASLFVANMIAAVTYNDWLRKYADLKREHDNFVDRLQKNPLLRGYRFADTIIKDATYTSRQIIDKFLQLGSRADVRDACFKNAGQIAARLALIDKIKILGADDTSYRSSIPYVDFPYALLSMWRSPNAENSLNLVDLLALAKLDLDQTYFKNIIEQLGRQWRYLEDTLLETPDPNLTEDENVRRVTKERLINDLGLNADRNRNFVDGLREFVPAIPNGFSLAELKLLLQGPPPDAESFNSVIIEFDPANNPTGPEKIDIERWIREIVVEQSQVDPEFVSKFYAYLTGSAVVPDKLRIKMLPRSDLPGRYLESHTCSNLLDIYRDEFITSKATFKKELIDDVESAARTKRFTSV